MTTISVSWPHIPTRHKWFGFFLITISQHPSIITNIYKVQHWYSRQPSKITWWHTHGFIHCSINPTSNKRLIVLFCKAAVQKHELKSLHKYFTIKYKCSLYLCIQAWSNDIYLFPMMLCKHRRSCSTVHAPSCYPVFQSVTETFFHWHHLKLQ